MAQERVMTCDGAWRPGRVGYCHYNEESVGAEKIFEVCELYERCVLRARVVPDISGPNFTILRVYSVRKASGKGETWAAQVSGAWQNHQPPLGDDPVRLGLVDSLARPGGNMTGINNFIYELVAKRFALLHELVPAAVRVAVLVNPANAQTETTLRDVEAAARPIGLQIQIVKASTSREIDVAFAALVRDRVDALFVPPDPLFISRRIQIVQLAARHAVPTTYPVRDFAEAGGLMSYGTNTADAWRQTGVYTGRVLKGAKPAELPVLQPTKFELIINAQTARMLGLNVSDKLLATADEVIE
jgi:putative ABC transport system substrate-binding protein